MPGGSGEALRGPVSLLDEYTVLRKNDIDKANIPIYRWRGIVPFQHVLMYEKPNKKGVGDVTIKNFEQEEESNGFSIVSGTPSGASPTLIIADAIAASLVPGQFIVNENIYYDMTGVGVYQAKPTSIQSNLSPEVLKVSSVGAPGSASAGNTNVVVLRMFQWTSTTGTNNAGAQGTFATTDNLRRSSRSTFDGATSPTAVLLNPQLRTNYCQIFEKSFEVTELQQNVDKWSVENPLDYNQMKALYRFHREREQSFLLDGFGQEGNSSGRSEPTTWGCARVAALNATAPAAITEDTKGAFDNAVRPFLEKGTSGVRYCFGGAPALLRFEQLFQTYMHDSPLSGMKDLGIQVRSYQHPLGHELRFVYSREMSDSARYKNSFLVVNFEYINYMFLKGKQQSFDLYLDKGKGSLGLGDTEKTTKYQWRAICGLQFNFIDAAVGEVYFPF